MDGGGWLFVGLGMDWLRANKRVSNAMPRRLFVGVGQLGAVRGERQGA